MCGGWFDVSNHDGQIREAELSPALSLATDLGLDPPMEHVMR